MCRSGHFRGLAIVQAGYADTLPVFASGAGQKLCRALQLLFEKAFSSSATADTKMTDILRSMKGHFVLETLERLFCLRRTVYGF